MLSDLSVRQGKPSIGSSAICHYFIMDKLAIFFTFALLTFFSVGQALPQQPCHSDKENDIFKVNCANFSLPAVPVYLQINTWQLNLDHNKLELWRPSAHFSKYVNLHNLTIGNNSLTSIHQETFKYLKNLLHLNLWGNLLSEVPTAALMELRALRSLSLEGNHIKIIRKDAFFNLNNLTMLKLSGNHIFQVDVGALSGLVKLQHFEIQHNALLNLPPSLFQDLEHDLKMLLLYSNHWQCDCKLRWLVDYIRTVHMNWTNKMQVPRCDTPIHINQMPFLSVPYHLFACRVLMDSSRINIYVDQGKNITLICKVQSDPMANITWFFKDTALKNINGYFIQETGGVNNQNSLLFIENLNSHKVGEYKCVAQNPISQNSVTYTLAIKGMQFFTQPRVDKSNDDDDDDDNDSASIKIAIVTVCVLVGVLLFSVLAFIFWRRFTKLQKEREEELKLKIKKHFESNGDYKLDADNNKCPLEQADNDEMDPFYDTLKKPLDKIEPLLEKMGHLPNGGTYMSFRTDPLDSEVNAPSTILTNLDYQSDNNGMFWTEASRNDTSSNLSELACPLLEPPVGYNPGIDTWDHSSEVFPHLYTSTYPRHPGTFNSIHSFHPYTYDSSNSMTLNSPSNMDILTQDRIYNRSFSVANSQSGSVEDHNKRSASVGSLRLVAIPPKKPPRLHSCSSISQSDAPGKLSLPKPGSIDEFGTAV